MFDTARRIIRKTLQDIQQHAVSDVYLFKDSGSSPKDWSGLGDGSPPAGPGTEPRWGYGA